MKQAHGVEQAFQSLESAAPVLQGLLRPVLVRALQDSTLMRQLGSTALSQHLMLLGQILTSDPQRTSSKAFVHFAAGHDVEDIEEAYRFTKNLDAALQGRVESGLSRALQIVANESGQDTPSLLALARLLALAFSNLPFVDHVLGGGAIEPFLPPSESKQPAPRRPAKGKTNPSTKSNAESTGPETQTQPEQAVSPELAKFVGELVEVVAVLGAHEGSESGHVFVALGRVLEVSPNHVLIETQRDDERPGSRLLLGLTHIVAMRTLPTDSRVRASNAG